MGVQRKKFKKDIRGHMRNRKKKMHTKELNRMVFLMSLSQIRKL